MSVYPLNATFEGYVKSAIDARKLLESCLAGQHMHVPRNPVDPEPNDLIRSGTVFIYEQSSSGIAKWEDGRSWTELGPDEEGFLISKLRKPDCESHGLVKKSCTMSYKGIEHILVSYYREDDVKNGLLIAISSHQELQAVEPREELVICPVPSKQRSPEMKISSSSTSPVNDHQPWRLSTSIVTP